MSRFSDFIPGFGPAPGWGERSMIVAGLDWPAIAALMERIIKVVDEQVGTGEASFELIWHMTEMAHQELETTTHQFTPWLYSQYLIHLEESKARGFFSSGGLESVIFIDPESVNPVTDERPAWYGPIEFDRGGSHDAPARVAAFFPQFFDEGMDKFENALTRQLGF